MGSHVGYGQGHAAAALGQVPGSMPPPPPSTWGINPKIELDTNVDVLAEPDTMPPHEHDVVGQSSELVSSQKDNEASAGAGPPKRKRQLKLTPSQRERKRAIDREAQRSIRLKTKNYIAHLESLVKVMEQNDATGRDGENNRTHELLNQLRQSQDEVRRLREAMLGVQRVLGGVLGEGRPPAQDPSQRGSSSSASPPAQVPPNSAASFSAPISRSTDAAPFWIPSPLMQNPPNQAASAQAEVLPDRPQIDPNQRKCEGEMFFYAEYHLCRVYNTGPAAFENRSSDEDIIVRAVVEGWHAVHEQYQLDLGWEVLQEVDQVIFCDCGVVERMAALRLMRMKLLHVVNGKFSAPPPPGNIPSYMTKEVLHQGNRANVIDNFVWPGFRKVLMDTPEKYISNHFNDKFRRNLKFLWPFSIGDTYTRDAITGLYANTPEFVQRQSDIRCWTMRRQFFDGSQELISVIPAYEADVPRPLLPPTGIIEEDQIEDQGIEATHMGSDPGMQSGVDMPSWHAVQTHGQTMDQYWQIAPPVNQDYEGLVSQAGSGYLS